MPSLELHLIGSRRCRQRVRRGVRHPAPVTRDQTALCLWDQRELKMLEKLRHIQRQRLPKRRGQGQGYRYQLAMQTGPAPKGQDAARSPDLRPGQAASSPLTRPQSLRLKPSIEPSYEPSRKITTSDSAERLQAFQRKQEGVEVVQNRIARRIGDDGWLVLGEMSDAQRARLSTLERQGRLDDETLGSAVLAIRYMRPP